jgi:hypothetical protein
MKKQKSRDDFNFINQRLNRNKKIVNCFGCSSVVDTVNKRDLNRMKRQAQKTKQITSL